MSSRNKRRGLAAVVGAAVVVSPLAVGVASAQADSNVKQYWGVPQSFDNSKPSNTPRTWPKSVTRGLVKDAATKKRLAGLHPKGLHVLRHNAPKIGAVKVAKVGNRHRLTIPVSAKSALRGKVPAKANERVFVKVVLAKRVTRKAVQPVAYSKVQRITINKSKKTQRTNLSFTLPKKASKKFSGMKASERNNALTIRVMQVIDVDGKKIRGRQTADHVKVTNASLGSSKARKQGQGTYVAVVNNDNYPQGSTWPAPNMTSNPLQCMYTNGDSGSNLQDLTVTGMTPSQSVETYLEADSNTFHTVTGQSFPTSQLVGNISFDIPEAIVEASLGWPVGISSIVSDSAEMVAEFWGGDCSSAPSAFQLTVADPVGNSTTQGYILSSNFQGLSDFGSAQEYYNVNGPSRYATYLSDMLDTAQSNGYAANTQPGWVSSEDSFAGGWGIGSALGGGSGADNGLALQINTFGKTIPNEGTQPQANYGTQNGNSQYELVINALNGCSTNFQGTWVWGNNGVRTQPSNIINGCYGDGLKAPWTPVP